MKEDIIEATVTDYAVQLGWETYKWSSPNKKSILDRLFFKDGVAFAIEFKTQKNKASKGQQKEALRLYSAGIRAVCINNIQKGKEFVYEMDLWAERSVGRPPVLREYLETFE